MSANAIETLREACDGLTRRQDALAAVEALLEAAKDACERNPAHLLNLRVAIRRVETGQ